MGAKERAAHRGKKAANGSMKGQPRSQKQLNQSILVPDLNSAFRSQSLQSCGKFAQSSGARNGFSMSEEARNTDRRQVDWSSTSLRSKGISFVSAGTLKREEDAWNTVSEEDTSQKQSAAKLATQVEENKKGQAPSIHPLVDSSNESPRSPAQVRTENAETPQVSVSAPFVEQVSAVQSEPATNGRAPPASDSEEEIVFSGRAGGSQISSRRPTPAPPPAQMQGQNSTTTSHEAAEKMNLPQVKAGKSLSAPTANSMFATSAIGLDSPLDDSNPVPTRYIQRKKLPFGGRYDEDDLMQDYIDNMAIDDSDEEAEADMTGPSMRRKPFKKTETFRMFNGDGLENEKVQTNGKKKGPAYVLEQAIDWDSDDLADFDDLSTSDEEIEEICQVIRHRTRVSGAQYLVVADGNEASDAKWILHSKLTSESAVKEIEIYEEIRTMNIEEDSVDDDGDNDDDDSDADEEEEALRDLIDNIESEDDENARIMSYTARMTDEQLARALAKQEELGLGSDELVLFNGEAAEDESPVDDAFGGGEDFISFSLGKHTSNRGRSKKNKKARDSFPSAEAFADALDQDPYGAFDIMDFERPSLRPKKKGRKSDFPFDLADLDDELRDQLVNTWTKDREKKAERKRQKEEARLTANLDAEEGGDPAVIKARMRQFLVQDVETLKLSSMDSATRAAVHRLAKALKLNSRSEGKEGVGAGRYPVLTKTPRTPYYTMDTIWEIDALMNTRKFFPKTTYGRSKKTPRSTKAARPQRGGGGGVMSGATYRDGEEVGASAPELGAENKGRAMLERMGWTMGMGIGAEGNKGNISHIKHIVKTTKAGLG